jgi:hypothetical protein
MIMDSFEKKALGGAALLDAVVILVLVTNKPKVYNIIGDEIINIVPHNLPEPYVVDTYESAVSVIHTWDHLEADETPLPEIEPVDDYVYEYILDEPMEELPPLQG